MSSHTPGPWRWEVNFTSKTVHLVGGRPLYDLTIMDFERWGMNDATVTLRDLAHDGMNIMHKLHERPDWTAPFPGREHHARWCQAVIHPDMQLIQAAPDLLQALVAAARNAEDCAFNEWLNRASPLGNVDAVQHQWEDSRQYQEYCDTWRMQLDAIRKARGEE